MTERTVNLDDGVRCTSSGLGQVSAKLLCALLPLLYCIHMLSVKITGEYVSAALAAGYRQFAFSTIYDDAIRRTGFLHVVLRARRLVQSGAGRGLREWAEGAIQQESMV